MYICTDRTEVETALIANTPRSVDEVMRETHPEATFDGRRYHAPYDGYVCPLTGEVYRGGEFLPNTNEPAYSSRSFGVMAKCGDEVISWYGTPAMIAEARSVLRRQTLEYSRARSSHVGTVGGKISVEVTVSLLRKFDGYYGPVYFTIMEDENGNVFIYKGSKHIGREEEQFIVTAKVKEHTEYKGVKQTIIERPKRV